MVTNPSPQPVQILPSLVAERIAAGEVIERPASVVKELVENALDAHATQVEVRLTQGGRDSIVVTDNGSGMTSDDLELSVCRHATSKIRSVDDLMNLDSLGFRGEALPSIAAVSSLTMTSSQGQDTFQIHVEQTAPTRARAQKVANRNFLGDDHGTVVEVRSLFSQVPARLKFLKSPSAEASACREILERLALAHGQTRFKLMSDDRVLLDLPAEPLSKRVARILGDGNPFEMIHVQLPGSWEIELFWLKGLSQSNTRSMIQVVNGRTLKDRVLQQALLLPLKQSLLPGQFPSLMARLQIPADELDVNVHPNKTEVRFLDSKKIFALCQAGVQKLLEQSRPQFVAPFVSDFISDQVQTEPTPGIRSFEAATPSLEYGIKSFHSTPSTTSTFQEAWSSPMGEFRGVLFATYLIFEQAEELVWIDQHAAHERIRYEKLKAAILNRATLASQQLLVPEVIQLRPEALNEIKNQLPRLADLGFEAEVFGEQSVLFRSVPAVWGTTQLSTRLFNLLDRLKGEAFRENWVWDEVLFEKIAMEACKSSIRAGDAIDSVQAHQLAAQLLSCDHFGNCPHGRPTLVRIKKNKVDEWFQRNLKPSF